MGRQTGFFTLPADDRILLQACEQRGMRAVPAIIPANAPVEPAPPLLFKLDPAVGLFYLMPAGARIEAAVYERTDDPSRSVIMPFRSALLQYVPCRRSGDAIANGRIYFDTRRPNLWFEDVRRDFESLSRLIKRWSATDKYKFYVGPSAVESVLAGTLKLTNSGDELHLA